MFSSPPHWPVSSSGGAKRPLEPPPGDEMTVKRPCSSGPGACEPEYPTASKVLDFSGGPNSLLNPSRSESNKKAEKLPETEPETDSDTASRRNSLMDTGLSSSSVSTSPPKTDDTRFVFPAVKAPTVTGSENSISSLSSISAERPVPVLVQNAAKTEIPPVPVIPTIPAVPSVPSVTTPAPLSGLPSLSLSSFPRQPWQPPAAPQHPTLLLPLPASGVPLPTASAPPPPSLFVPHTARGTVSPMPVPYNMMQYARIPQTEYPRISQSAEPAYAGYPAPQYRNGALPTAHLEGPSASPLFAAPGVQKLDGPWQKSATLKNENNSVVIPVAQLQPGVVSNPKLTYRVFRNVLKSSPAPGEVFEKVELLMDLRSMSFEDAINRPWSQEEKDRGRRIIRIDKHQVENRIYILVSVVPPSPEDGKADGKTDDRGRHNSGSASSTTPVGGDSFIEVSCIAFGKDPSQPRYWITSIEVITIVEFLSGQYRRQFDGRLNSTTVLKHNRYTVFKDQLLALRNERRRIASNLMAFYDHAALRKTLPDRSDGVAMLNGNKGTPGTEQGPMDESTYRSQLYSRVMDYDKTDRPPTNFDKPFKVMRWERLNEALVKAMSYFTVSIRSCE